MTSNIDLDKTAKEYIASITWYIILDDERYVPKELRNTTQYEHTLKKIEEFRKSEKVIKYLRTKALEAATQLSNILTLESIYRYGNVNKRDFEELPEDIKLQILRLVSTEFKDNFVKYASDVIFKIETCGQPNHFHAITDTWFLKYIDEYLDTSVIRFVKLGDVFPYYKKIRIEYDDNIQYIDRFEIITN